MLCSQSLVLLVCAAAASAWLAAAAPVIVYPLAAQQPPVARVGQSYVFSVLDGSFASARDITYTADGLPAWLEFDPVVCQFFGVPAAADVGHFNVTLTATDTTGSARSSVRLVVSANAPPVLRTSFSQQIARESLRKFASAEAMPGATGVMVPPFWSFSLGWDGETFQRPSAGGNGRLYYMARLRGETGLPDWLQFSNTTFTFNGVAPANGTYPVIVTATDYWGYAAAQTSFILSVGKGEAVELMAPWTPLRTVANAPVSYQFNTSAILVGGKQLAAHSQISLAPNLTNFKWLSYNNATRTLSGVTPQGLRNGTQAAGFSIPVTISSIGLNSTLANLAYLPVDIRPYAFTDFVLPNRTIVAGQWFEHNLDSVLLDKTVSVGASVVPPDAASWLLYYPHNRTLTGVPPLNITYSAIDVTYKATATGNVTSTAAFHADITGVEGPTGTGEPAPVPEGKVSRGLSTRNKIIIGVVVGVGGLVLILLALLLLCCCRRRRQRNQSQEQQQQQQQRNQQGKQDGYGDPRRLREKRETPQGSGNSRGSKIPATPGNKSFDTEVTLTRTPADKDKDPSVPSDSLNSARRIHGLEGLFGTSVLATPPGKDATDSPATKHSPISPITPQSDDASFLADGEVVRAGGAAAAGGRDIKQPIMEDTEDSRSALTEFSQSRDSWESTGSFHWSQEDQYLAPLTLPPTPSPPATAAATTSAAAAGPLRTAQQTVPPPSVDDQPRPRPGFYPRIPRNLHPSDVARFISNDDVSYPEFSEFHDPATRSLDSFIDPGSAFGTASSGSRLAQGSSLERNGSWWRSESNRSNSHRSRSHSNSHRSTSNPSNFGASDLFSSGFLGSEVSSVGPAIVATAERRQPVVVTHPIAQPQPLAAAHVLAPAPSAIFPSTPAVSRSRSGTATITPPAIVTGSPLVGPPFAGTAFSAGPYAPPGSIPPSPTPAPPPPVASRSPTPVRRVSSSRPTMANLHASRARAAQRAASNPSSDSEDASRFAPSPSPRSDVFAPVL